MSKDNKKKPTTKKPATKKPTQKPKKEVKKTTTKKEVKKPTVKKEEKKLEKIVFTDNLSANECIHCKKYFDKKLTICPFCNRDQKNNLGRNVILILLLIFLILFATSRAYEKRVESSISEEEYKLSSRLLSYEELVRRPIDYKGTNVKVIGEVIKVEGIDLSYGNVMTITLDTNLFEGSTEQLIKFEYIDKNYEMGIINGDLITVYGDYTSINGNIPFIDAKYIVFGS